MIFPLTISETAALISARATPVPKRVVKYGSTCAGGRRQPESNLLNSCWFIPVFSVQYLTTGATGKTNVSTITLPRKLENPQTESVDSQIKQK